MASLKDKEGNKVVLEFQESMLVNHAVIMEDYKYGERIRKYKIEGLAGGKWLELTQGISVGRKKIDYFDEIKVEALKLTINESAAKPLIRSFSAFYVDNFSPPKKQSMHVWSRPQIVLTWNSNDIKSHQHTLRVELNNKISVPGQYVLTVKPELTENFKIKNASMLYDGNLALKEFVKIDGLKVFINQTAQITDKRDLYVILDIELKEPSSGKVEFLPLLIH